MTVPAGTGPAGWRVLYVSIRGHRYLVGSPTVHPVDTVPVSVGRRFASFGDIDRFARRDLRGLSALCSVEIVDDGGSVVRRGTRSGHNGTGNRWTWQDTTTVHRQQ
ncbi:hypothetical protein [Dactylosporangium sp. NPDC005555]|uniref:hypothetical protein n=1 Tax=Dactylosporangium sp. NPDC005555 TaxID=3154889 RepID=UPI0033A79C70